MVECYLIFSRAFLFYVSLQFLVIVKFLSIITADKTKLSSFSISDKTVDELPLSNTNECHENILLSTVGDEINKNKKCIITNSYESGNNNLDNNLKDKMNFENEKKESEENDLNQINDIDLLALDNAELSLVNSASSQFNSTSLFDDNVDGGEMKLSAIRKETLELPQINYASRECLAKVLYANEEAVNKGAVLDEKDLDFYLRNPCDLENKFLIIQLCEYIRPTMFEIANFEFFSSNPKHIRLSVSDVYPTLEWTVIAEFAAEDVHEIQRFPITAQDMFIKFFKVEFLLHYGSEYFCTVSFLRVFGISKVDSVNYEIPSLIESQDPNKIIHSFQGSGEEYGIKLPPSLQHLLACFQCSSTSMCQNTRNYASKECGANVLFANSEAVNKGGVLYDKDLDFYLRNPCKEAQDKFLILRLCESIQPTKLEIANFEYFSSGPKNIRLSVSKTYPTNEWSVVGEFEAQNTRDVQCFPIFPIGSYVKFVKLELLSNYGSEYFCTLSFLRVYGISKEDEYDDGPANNSTRREKNGKHHLENEVYVLKWIITVILTVFAMFIINNHFF